MPFSWTAADCRTVGGDVGVQKLDLLGQPRRQMEKKKIV